MGQTGVWTKIKETSTDVALAALGYKSLLKNRRRYKVAIDMGAWLVHSAWSPGFKNPEIRCLYYRLLLLLTNGIAPIIIFDGKHRPNFKRGARIFTGAHRFQAKLIALAEALGIEYRVAPGEAEAEAALLAKTGVVDAVLSDDFDALMFGAPVVMRNWSVELSGSKSDAKGKDEARRKTHVAVYDLEEIEAASPEFTPDGIAFMAILSGGDYDEGLKGCGIEAAIGLIRAGLHQPLVFAIRSLDGEAQREALQQWREAVRDELRNNTSGKLKRKAPALAASLPPDFPAVDIVRAYLDPVTSQHLAHQRPLAHDFRGRIDVAAVVRFFTHDFDWNHAEIVDKVKNGLRRALIMREIADVVESNGTIIDLPSAPFFECIPRRSTSERRHASTDEIAEMRIQLDHQRPWPFLKEAERALTQPDPNIGKADEWRRHDAAKYGTALPDKEGDYVSKHNDDGRIWLSSDLLEQTEVGRRLMAEYREARTASPAKRGSKKTSSGAASSPTKRGSTLTRKPKATSSRTRAASSSESEAGETQFRFSSLGWDDPVQPQRPSSQGSSRPPKASTSRVTVDLTDDDEDLPDIHALPIPRRAPKSPKRSRSHQSMHDIIDLVSNSDVETPRAPVSPGKRGRKPVHADTSTAGKGQTLLSFSAAKASSSGAMGAKPRAKSASADDVFGTRVRARPRPQFPAGLPPSSLASSSRTIIELD